MDQGPRIFLILIIIILLSYALSSCTGTIYEKIVGHQVGGGGWIGPECPECWAAFTVIFSFLSGLLFFGFLFIKRFKVALPFILFFPVLALLARDGEAFLTSLGFGLIGLGLGQVVYLVRKKFKSKCKDNKEAREQEQKN